MTTDPVLQQRVEQFLYHEAALLERRDFDAWLALLSDDIEYWIPNLVEDSDRAQDAMISYEDHTALRARAIRMNHPQNPTQMPPPRTKYFITNVMPEPADSDEMDVTSSLLLVVTVPGRALMQHPMTVYHRLREVDGAWRVCRKKIYLITNNQPLFQLPLI